MKTGRNSPEKRGACGGAGPLCLEPPHDAPAQRQKMNRDLWCGFINGGPFFVGETVCSNHGLLHNLKSEDVVCKTDSKEGTGMASAQTKPTTANWHNARQP